MDRTKTSKQTLICKKFQNPPTRETLESTTKHLCCLSLAVRPARYCQLMGGDCIATGGTSKPLVAAPELNIVSTTTGPTSTSASTAPTLSSQTSLNCTLLLRKQASKLPNHQSKLPKINHDCSAENTHTDCSRVQITIVVAAAQNKTRMPYV